jgi:hypothetical protein
MIKIKKNRRDYNRVLFCSDFHYGHDKEFLWSKRGFANAQEHNEWIRCQVNSLQPNDLLINLGDVGLSVGAEAIQDFMMSFPCETLMIFGNHNSGVQQLYQQHLPKGFEKCQLYPLQITPNITLLGYEFLLDIDSDRLYCRHMAPLIWPECGKGRNCVTGHSHSNLKAANPNENGIGKVLDCGVENAMNYNGTAFFDIYEVSNILAQKTDNKIDHHS